MTNLIDKSSGEVLADAPQSLLAKWRATPGGAAIELAGERDDELIVLVMIARATGRLQSKATVAIVDWLASCPWNAPPDREVLRKGVVGREEPTQTDWRRALKSLAEHDVQRKESLIAAIEKMPTTRKQSAIRKALALDAIASLRATS